MSPAMLSANDSSDKNKRRPVVRFVVYSQKFVELLWTFSLNGQAMSNHPPIFVFEYLDDGETIIEI